MCDNDWDGAVPFVDEWRRARKEYRCFACAETIRPGDRYHVTVQKDEDDFGCFKHCARCWSMFEEILEAGADAVQYDLHCGVSWEEAFDDPPPEKVARLAFMTPDEAQKELEKTDGTR